MIGIHFYEFIKHIYIILRHAFVIGMETGWNRYSLPPPHKRADITYIIIGCHATIRALESSDPLPLLDDSTSTMHQQRCHRRKKSLNVTKCRLRLNNISYVIGIAATLTKILNPLCFWDTVFCNSCVFVNAWERERAREHQYWFCWAW